MYIIIIIIASIFSMLGCKSTVNEPADPIAGFTLDGTWQARIFDPNYEFTNTLATLRTTGAEVKGQIISDCFGLSTGTDIPFRITEGVYTGTDVTLTFLMESTGIIGHFNGNIKNNLLVNDGKEIVGHLYFEYSGTLTKSYDLHLIRQSINYLPKNSD